MSCVGGRCSARFAAALLLMCLPAFAAPRGVPDDSADRLERFVGASGPAQKGMTFASWRVGGYSEPTSDRSLAELAATGATWVTLIVTAYQEDIDSTEVCYQNEITPPESGSASTPTDADLTHVINQAHSLGLSVMLKPHVDLVYDDDHWRGEIGMNFRPADWTAWFASYGDFITHYAALADFVGVEQFCVGAELTATAERAGDWRDVIAAVRAVYGGNLVYAANWYVEDLLVNWWDALDYIGIDAYYPLVSPGNLDPTLAELEDGWAPYVSRMADLADIYGKHVILTEIGYRSLDGTCGNPYLYQIGGAPDRAEQQLAYQAAFESFFAQPWFAGMYWWVWETDPLQGSPYDDLNYTPHHKAAERTLRTWYGGPEAPFLRVESRPFAGVPITGLPFDVAQGGEPVEPQAGETYFSRTMALSDAVNIVAPKQVTSSGAQYTFVKWARNSSSMTAGKRTLAFTIAEDTTAIAVYKRLKYLKLVGPAAPRESSHAKYVCYACFTDGTRYNMTPSAIWKDYSSRVAFTAPGYLKTYSVRADTRVRIRAAYGGKTCYLYVTIRNAR